MSDGLRNGNIVECTLGRWYLVLKVDGSHAKVEDVATKLVYTAPVEDLTLVRGVSPR